MIQRLEDLMTRDLFGCDHEPIIPVVDDSGQVLYWLCQCGRKHLIPKSQLGDNDAPR